MCVVCTSTNYGMRIVTAIWKTHATDRYTYVHNNKKKTKYNQEPFTSAKLLLADHFASIAKTHSPYGVFAVQPIGCDPFESMCSMNVWAPNGCRIFFFSSLCSSSQSNARYALRPPKERLNGKKKDTTVAGKVTASKRTKEKKTNEETNPSAHTQPPLFAALTLHMRKKKKKTQTATTSLSYYK